jgi:hypothetical protein
VYEFPDGYNFVSLCLESTYNVVSIYLKPTLNKCPLDSAAKRTSCGRKDLKPTLKETVEMVQYWLDRARITDGPTDVTVVPVSFVVANSYQDNQLKRLVAPEDEIIVLDMIEEAKNDWVFELKSGDVLPVQIIASIQATMDASKFDGMMFPVVYRGNPVLEKRFYKRSGGDNVQQANMPIFNLNPPPVVSEV